MKFLILLLSISTITLACGGKAEESNESQETETPALEETESFPEDTIEIILSEPVIDTSIVLNYNGLDVPVELKAARTDEIKGTVLLLHGWNLPHTEWCEKTALCEYLVDSGYHVVMPNFGKTTYHWDVFPETREDYKQWPTRRWMMSTNGFLSVIMDRYDVFFTDQNNIAVGLSTGGRGAAFFALEQPMVFNGCVALSADFDQTKISDEPINNGYYGSYAEFPDRWEGMDNIYNSAEDWSCDIYLGHGVADKMCPVSQSQEFAKRLKEIGKVRVVESYPDHGHNYDYWDSETEAIIEFIQSLE